jgi:hypothetical protein
MRNDFAALVLQFSALASAACTRESLSTTAKTFFEAAFAKSTSRLEPLSRTVKISQNNILLPGLNESIFANITSFASNYTVEAMDTRTCDIATLAVPKEGNETAIVSVRIRTTKEVPGEITQVEIINALRGSHALFTPQNLPQPAPPIWRMPEANPTNTSREALLKIVDTYPQALQEGNNTMALAAPICPRLENGYKTTQNCNLNADMFKWPVTDRRWVVDTRTHVVMASFFFHYKDGKGLMSQMDVKDRTANSTVGLLLHEYFKVSSGLIVDVTAVMQTLGADYKDVWKGL